MKKLVSLLVVALLVLMVTPVLADGHQTITEIVVDGAEFTILEAALLEADLADDLAGAGPFTVFAPTDAAFGDLLTELDITEAQLLAHPQLAEVLLYHVVSGTKAMSTDLSDGQEIETMQGEKVTITTDGGVFVNESEVIDVDINASNGVIHVIDKVLVPEAFVLTTDTIVDIALGNDDFSILVSALQKADLVGALSGEGPYTVFAPTNDAFAALLDELGITAEQLLAHPQLADVLLYHVVAAKAMSTDLSNGQEIGTMQGEDITITINDDGVFINDSKVTTADLEAQNGVVHVIDEVLVPAAFVLGAAEEEPEEEVPETGSNNTLPVAAAMLILGLGSLTLGKVLSKGKAK